MKTIISQSLLITLLFVAFSGCELYTADSQESNGPEIETLTIAREIGRQHNAGLDYILQRMKERKEPFADREEAMAFFKANVLSYLRTDAGVERDLISDYARLDHIFAPGTDRQSVNEDRTAGGEPFRNSSLELRPEQVDHIRKIMDIYAMNGGANFFEGDYRPLVRSANRDLSRRFSREETLVIQGVSEIMSASFVYWRANRSEWIKEIVRLAPEKVEGVLSSGGSPVMAYDCYTPLPVPCAFIDWDQVIIEDGGGLIEGVVADAVIWFFRGPPGWVLGGAIAGGSAAGASAKEVYLQLIEYF